MNPTTSPKKSKSFIIAWSIVLVALVIFNMALFLAPFIDDSLTAQLNNLGIIAVIIYLFLWPAFLFTGALATFGMLIALVVDIIVLTIFLLQFRKAN